MLNNMYDNMNIQGFKFDERFRKLGFRTIFIESVKSQLLVIITLELSIFIVRKIANKVKFFEKISKLFQELLLGNFIHLFNFTLLLGCFIELSYQKP